MVSPYLLRVISKPKKVDGEQWTKWYLDEHVPDLVNSETAVRAGFYHAFDDFELSTKTPEKSEQTKLGDQQLNHTDVEPPTEKRFLAMYQTEFEDPFATENMKKVRLQSDMLPGREVMECADFDVRVYKLIENYDPKGLGEVQSPFILNVQVEPADDDDYNKFYHEEHLGMLSKVPGYRRSQRYQLVTTREEKDTRAKGPARVPKFMAVHEFEHLNSLDGPELREADASPNTIRVFGNAKMVNIRGFKLVKGWGYTNSQ